MCSTRLSFAVLYMFPLLFSFHYIHSAMPRTLSLSQSHWAGDTLIEEEIIEHIVNDPEFASSLRRNPSMFFYFCDPDGEVFAAQQLLSRQPLLFLNHWCSQIPLACIEAMFTSAPALKAPLPGSARQFRKWLKTLARGRATSNP